MSGDMAAIPHEVLTRSIYASQYCTLYRVIHAISKLLVLVLQTLSGLILLFVIIRVLAVVVYKT